MPRSSAEPSWVGLARVWRSPQGVTLLLGDNSNALAAASGECGDGDMTTLSVRHIISVGNSEKTRQVSKMCEEKDVQDVRHARCMMPDRLRSDAEISIDESYEPLVMLSAAFAACEEAVASKAEADPQAAVLVHCDMGHNRSPSLVLAFLLMRGLSLREAYRTLLAARPTVDPLPSYRRALCRLELAQRGSCSIKSSEEPWAKHLTELLSECGDDVAKVWEVKQASVAKLLAEEKPAPTAPQLQRVGTAEARALEQAVFGASEAVETREDEASQQLAQALLASVGRPTANATPLAWTIVDVAQAKALEKAVFGAGEKVETREDEASQRLAQALLASVGDVEIVDPPGDPPSLPEQLAAATPSTTNGDDDDDDDEVKIVEPPPCQPIEVVDLTSGATPPRPLRLPLQSWASLTSKALARSEATRKKAASRARQRVYVDRIERRDRAKLLMVVRMRRVFNAELARAVRAGATDPEFLAYRALDEAGFELTLYDTQLDRPRTFTYTCCGEEASAEGGEEVSAEGGCGEAGSAYGFTWFDWEFSADDELDAEPAYKAKEREGRRLTYAGERIVRCARAYLAGD